MRRPHRGLPPPALVVAAAAALLLAALAGAGARASSMPAYGVMEEYQLYNRRMPLAATAEVVVYVHVEECEYRRVTNATAECGADGAGEDTLGATGERVQWCCVPPAGRAGQHVMGIFYPKVDELSILWMQGAYAKFASRTSRFWIELGCGGADCVHPSSGALTNTTRGVTKLYTLQHEGAKYVPQVSAVVDLGDPARCSDPAQALACGTPRYIAFDESLSCASCDYCMARECGFHSFAERKGPDLVYRNDLVVYLGWQGRDAGGKRLLRSAESLPTNFQRFAIAPIYTALAGIDVDGIFGGNSVPGGATSPAAAPGAMAAAAAPSGGGR